MIFWREGEDALRLPQLSLTGEGFDLTAGLRIEGLDTGLNTSGRITLTAADLSRFAALAGVPLAGSAMVSLEGEASRLTGGFDLALDMAATGLRTGSEQADRLTAGETRLTAAARRDETGTTLRALDLTADGLALSASGTLSSTGNDLAGQVTLADLGVLDPAWGGSLAASARLTGTSQDGALTLSGQASGLSIGQPKADRLIAGDTALDLSLRQQDGRLFLTSAQLNGANLTAEATGTDTGDTLQVTGRIRDLALLADGYPGPVTLSGSLTPAAGGATMDLRVLGPAGIDTRVAGRISGSGADLTVQGAADAALLNAVADPATLAGALRLDLALRGPFALSSLTGRVTLSGGRIAYPYRGLSLTRTELVADLAQGRARLSATSDLTAGGRLRLGGNVGLAAPFDATLDLQLDSLRLRDPELYDTTLSGQLQVTGPLTGRASLAGGWRWARPRCLIPASGFASASDLAGDRSCQ